MKSHTVPKRLLEQFAFDDRPTASKRLCRYERGREPYDRASPKTATRWDRHFEDPADAAKEKEIEDTLKREYEDPVNLFLPLMNYKTFAFTSTHIRLLTGYITLLFNRSRARRSAADLQAKWSVDALRGLRSDDKKLSNLVERVNVKAIRSGMPPDQVATKADLVEVIDQNIAEYTASDQPQRRYIQAVQTMMRYDDEQMRNGDWTVLRAHEGDPFVIGDAPVVTWERIDSGDLIFGQGFARPNVEVFLPVSPTACLNVIPAVPRTRPVRLPSTEEVNRAQAAFASQYCFTNVSSERINSVLQPEFGRVTLGVNGFALLGRDHTQALYEVLMRQLA